MRVDVVPLLEVWLPIGGRRIDELVVFSMVVALFFEPRPPFFFLSPSPQTLTRHDDHEKKSRKKSTKT